jgi:putative protease
MNNLDSSITMRLPELLAPAGDWECARAAVENGADAIYFGLDKFNARMRAQNFVRDDLPKLMKFLHRRGVKGYVTFNTLVFENELAAAEECLRDIIAAGVDAAIVQDVGICRLIRRLSPDFPIHVSTQMTVTSAAGVEFARELGCQLVVLARECSLKEIEKIFAANAAPLPLEVFVHGALCVAYSGQCLTSESLGGRSANRGVCAQACRLPYELVSDGQNVPLGDKKYLLSPQDLAGLPVLPDLIRAGVTSLKIEGRLKSPEYVANITRVYRQALDSLSAQLPRPRKPSDDNSPSPGGEGRGEGELISRGHEAPNSSSQYEMEMAFSRGLYTGWFGGINNQELVHARFGKKRGVYLGEIAAIEGRNVRLKLEGPLKPGDGVVFDAGHPEETEEGGRVYTVERRGGDTLLGFGHGDLDLNRLHRGDKLWKTSDPELERNLRQTFAGDTPKFQRPLTMEVRGALGKPFTLIVRDGDGHEARVESAMPLVRADKQPLTPERLRAQLGRLGGTPFELGELKSSLAGDIMLPVSELNRLRRAAVDELLALRGRPNGWALNRDAGLQSVGTRCSASEADEKVSFVSDGRLFSLSQRERAGVRESSSNLNSRLIVLIRSLPQLQAAMDSGIETIYCEFEDPKKYRDAVKLFREAKPSSGRSRGDEAQFESFNQSSADGRSKSIDRPVASPSPPGEGRGLSRHSEVKADEGELKSRGHEALTKEARARVRSIFVAPPRIFKMGEDWVLKQVRSCEADGYLVRNYDHLQYFGADCCVGDYSLNVANHLSAGYFKNKFRLERLTASYDLNFEQLEALLRGAPPEWFEITIHQHIPMFHMEHCVFCAFLSSGTDYTNCGRPCDHHDVQLRDRVGALHPLKADAGCRNTVFNTLAQTGADYVDQMLALGARNFRLEFLNETPDQIKQTIGRYRQLLRGEITGQQLWRELKLLNQLGVTRGQIAGAT